MKRQDPDPLSRTFAALADPTRRAILARLVTGSASVTDLARPFAISQPAISRHLRVLAEAGLINRTRDAQWRRCHLAAAPLQGAAGWLAQYRPFWQQKFDALDAHLARQPPQEETDNDASTDAAAESDPEH